MCTVVNKTLTWRDVFDCKSTYWHISHILKAASEAGYDYFVWNGRVYAITPNGEKDTGLLAEALTAHAEFARYRSYRAARNL